MNKIKLLLGASTFFLLGFFASEYYRYGSLPKGGFQLAMNAIKNTGITSAEMQMPAANGLPESGLPESLAIQTVAGAEAQHLSTSDEFSWERVNRYIADENYDGAIRLLKHYLESHADSAPAWFLLAQAYQQQKKHRPAMDAWFRYLSLERDAQKIEQAVKYIKNYLLLLNETPAMFADDFPWLVAQFDKLLAVNANDGELQLLLAMLYLKIEDRYQAQYHALMAVNDPAVQQRAEEFLAKLNGKKITNDLAIPLLRFGNQYLVGVTIEGHAARLLLDTGASLSGVSKSYAAQYPAIVKSTKPIRLNTASGSEDSYLFTVNDLSIESLVFEQHILTLLPMDNAEGFDGLLGADILGQFDFVIDQDALVLRLRARKK